MTQIRILILELLILNHQQHFLRFLICTQGDLRLPIVVIERVVVVEVSLNYLNH